MIGRLGVIHRASLQLHAMSDPEVMAREIVGILHDVVPHDFAAVYVLEGARLVPFAVSDRMQGSAVLEADKQYLASLDLRVGENVTGWVARHDESLLINDVLRDPRYLDSRPGVQSELCVPMRSASGVTGVVNLESLQKNAYTESEKRVLEIVATQLSIAIENASMRARLQSLEKRLHDLVETLAANEETATPDQAIGRQVAELATAIGGMSQALAASESRRTKKAEAAHRDAET